MSTSVTLTDLLDRIGSELHRIAGHLADVGLAADGPKCRIGVLAGSEIVALQGIDRAEQMVRDLACVLRRIALSDAAAAHVDAAALTDGLLLGRSAEVIHGLPDASAVSGDLDLF